MDIVRAGTTNLAISALPFGTAARTLRRKWTRHRRSWRPAPTTARQLRFDQRLVDRAGSLPDTIIDIGALQCLQQLEQGRLVQGHRVVSLRAFLGGFTQRLTRWPLNITRHSVSRWTYTTRWDATVPRVGAETQSGSRGSGSLLSPAASLRRESEQQRGAHRAPSRDGIPT